LSIGSFHSKILPDSHDIVDVSGSKQSEHSLHMKRPITSQQPKKSTFAKPNESFDNRFFSNPMIDNPFHESISLGKGNLPETPRERRFDQNIPPAEPDHRLENALNKITEQDELIYRLQQENDELRQSNDKL
jgi:hypothetical protein